MQIERFRIRMATANRNSDMKEATVHRTETGEDVGAAEAIDRYAAAGCDVVITSGRDLHQATADAAGRHPDLVLFGIDQWHAETANWLYGFHFPGETGGLLAGALAASLTTSGTVAILVDGDGGPAADAWQTGFETGVAHADGAVGIVVEDATGDGAAAARAALDQGADVVFAADPDSSDSALVEVAGQPGAFCIGIGTDQWKAVPESQPCLVTSIVKSIGRRTIITNPVFESYHTRIVTTVTGEQSGETLDPGNWALDVELAPFHDHEDAVTNEVREMLTALDDSTRALHGDTAATTTAAPAPEEADHLGDGSLGYVRVEAGEDIQIRSLNAISGDVAFLGLPNQRAIYITLNQMGSSSGNVKGFQVSMGTGMDDLCSADGGAAAAQMIVADEDVVGVIGTSCSGAAAAAAPLISEAGMVMISPSNTSPSLTSDLAGTAGENNYPGYYRTAHNDLFQGAAAAGFALDVLGVTTAAAIHDGDPYTQGLARAFADAFEAGGGTVTGFTAVNKGDTDMVPVLTEIAAGSPELLFFPIFQPEGDFIVQQVGDVAGMDDVTMMAADGLMVSNFMELPESEGLYFSGPDLRFGNNRNQTIIGGSADGFLTHYVVVHGEKPSAAFWAHSVDATTLLVEAIDAASYVDDDGTLVIDRAGVREFLSGVRDYQGFTGLLSCDEFGDCGSQKITVIGHANSSDVDSSLENVIYEYSPAGGSQVGLLYDFSATSEFVQGVVEENGLNGATLIVVDRDEGVIYRDDFGEFEPGRISLIGNLGDTYSAGVLLRLHEDGLLDIDAPVSDVVGWGSGMPGVTVAQLLSHSSGMLGGVPSQAYLPYLCSLNFAGSLQGCGETIFTTPDDDADLVPPDTEFGWPGTGADYQVAGAVAEAASGKSWAELIDEIYVQPCGLKVLAYNNPWFQLPFDPATFSYPAVGGDPVSMLAPTENPSILGGAYTTADDIAALLLMYLRDGMCGDQQVLSTGSLDLMTEDRIARVYDGVNLDQFGKDWGYGMGWYTNRETGQTGNVGIFGSQMSIDRDDGFGVVVVLEASWLDARPFGVDEAFSDSVRKAILTARG